MPRQIQSVVKAQGF